MKNLRVFSIDNPSLNAHTNFCNIIKYCYNCKISFYHRRNETVTEDWYVFGQVHGQGRRELLGSSIFKATFTQPRIAFDKRELTFRIDICPNGEKLRQTGGKFIKLTPVRNYLDEENYPRKLSNLIFHGASVTRVF